MTHQSMKIYFTNCVNWFALCNFKHVWTMLENITDLMIHGARTSAAMLPTQGQGHEKEHWVS